MFWTSAFLLGFLGSFHCAVMCGPLVVAVAQNEKSSTSAHRLIKVLAYHSGRILTYMALGAVIGLLGQGLVLSGLQQSVSIFAGIVLLLIYFIPVWTNNNTLNFNRFFGHLTSWLRTTVRPYFKAQTTVAKLILGMINGLLPCGLVYVAIVAALTTGSPINGMAYMLSFGSGTLPMLLGIHFSSQRISATIGSRARRIIPYFVVGISLLFVLRGMNLGIKYLSPQIAPQETSSNITTCD